MTLTVRGENIAVRPEPKAEMTESGLHLVNDRQHVDMLGTVVAVGDGPRSKGGTLLPHEVEVGDRIVYGPGAGEELFFNKERIIIMRESDVLAVVG